MKEQDFTPNNDSQAKGKNRKERRADQAKYRKVEKQFKKEFGQNNEWTRLKTEVYAQAKSVFYPVESLVMSLRSREQTLKYMTRDEAEVFSRNCQILSRDIVAYKRELDTIYAIHADKDGNCPMEDWAIMLEITEKYFIFTSNFNAIISPIYDHIVDLLHILEHRRLLAEAQAQETQVTEGQFTEVTEETTNV